MPRNQKPNGINGNVILQNESRVAKKKKNAPRGWQRDTQKKSQM